MITSGHEIIKMTSSDRPTSPLLFVIEQRFYIIHHRHFCCTKAYSEHHHHQKSCIFLILIGMDWSRAHSLAGFMQDITASLDGAHDDLIFSALY